MARHRRQGVTRPRGFAWLRRRFPAVQTASQRAEKSDSVRVFNQKETLTLIHKPFEARAETDFALAFKTIFLCAALAAGLNINRRQGKTNQERSAGKSACYRAKRGF